MTTRFHAHFDGKQIVPDEALDLPLNQPHEVEVRTIGEAPKRHAATRSRPCSITELPFFGMWRDRPEMADSAAWVRGERANWPKRLDRSE